MTPSHPRSPDQNDGPDQDDGTDEAPRPQVHERWWWTGTFRAVLGGVVVGYQWPVVTAGEAGTLNWVMIAVGAAVCAWGLWLVWQAYQDQRA
jgi:hypothetical protein